MSRASAKELSEAGWSQLAGPFNEAETHMMAAFIRDAEKCNKETMVLPIGYATGGYSKEAKIIWQRSRRRADAMAA